MDADQLNRLGIGINVLAAVLVAPEFIGRRRIRSIQDWWTGLATLSLENPPWARGVETTGSPRSESQSEPVKRLRTSVYVRNFAIYGLTLTISFVFLYFTTERDQGLQILYTLALLAVLNFLFLWFLNPHYPRLLAIANSATFGIISMVFVIAINIYLIRMLGWKVIVLGLASGEGMFALDHFSGLLPRNPTGRGCLLRIAKSFLAWPFFLSYMMVGFLLDTSSLVLTSLLHLLGDERRALERGLVRAGWAFFFVGSILQFWATL